MAEKLPKGWKKLMFLINRPLGLTDCGVERGKVMLQPDVPRGPMICLNKNCGAHQIWTRRPCLTQEEYNTARERGEVREM